MMVSMLRDSIKGNPRGRPRADVPVEQVDLLSMDGKGYGATLTWFGHSALLLQMDGKILLLDPMLGSSTSPIPIFGGKRFSKKLPIEIENLPVIDAVLLSHDHYDHLDYQSIKKLKDKVKQFYVPLGVGSHLERWGVERDKIKEHDWWDEGEYEGLRIASTPARHTSGRGLGDHNATLWCSWVIEGRHAKIYFGGDSGYGPHFQAIGDKYGPFDLTMLESGQYDARWPATHLMPEETVQAHVDVQGKVLLPIHWGGFSLAFHDWDEPIERVLKAASEKGIKVTTPRIGEPVPIGSDLYPASAWWR